MLQGRQNIDMVKLKSPPAKCCLVENKLMLIFLCLLEVDSDSVPDYEVYQ